MPHSAILKMNGPELIGSPPSKGMLEVCLGAMEHCLFIHKTPQSAMEVPLDDIVRAEYYQGCVA